MHCFQQSAIFYSCKQPYQQYLSHQFTSKILYYLLLYTSGIFRMEGGIAPLVELLEFNDIKVQRAAARALRTLAFNNDANKNQVVDFLQ